jgi:hypothetical protein
VLPVRVFTNQKHRGLRDDKCAKADIGPLLAEEFPEFVFELGEEHCRDLRFTIYAIEKQTLTFL